MIGMTMAQGAAGVRCLQGFTLLVGATELIKLTEHFNAPILQRIWII